MSAKILSAKALQAIDYVRYLNKEALFSNTLSSSELDELRNMVVELAQVVRTDRPCDRDLRGRAEDIFKLISERPRTTKEISEELGMSERNIHVYYGKLRATGIKIGTTNDKRKYVEN